MSFGVRLKEKREELGMSQDEFAKKLGVSRICIANYENGKNYPKAANLIDILSVLKCDANYLMQDYFQGDERFRPLTEMEKDMINKYRIINDDGRKIVNSIIQSYYLAYLEFEKMKGSIELPCYIPTIKANGIVLNKNPRTIRIVNDSLNIQADYVMQIVTPHMKPIYHPGDYVLVKKNNVSNGDITLFELNNIVYVRRYFIYKNKTLLIPLNANYDTLDITNKECTCLGVVLGKVIGEICS